MSEEDLKRRTPAGTPEAPVAPPAGEGPSPAAGDHAGGGGEADGETVSDAAQEAPAGAAPHDAPPEAEVESDLEQLLATARGERDEYLALAQRTQADFENYRKRMARDVAAAEGRGVGKLAKELLPALDNLDLALKAAPPGDKLAEGVLLVRNELHAALARAGVESYSPHGEAFDPELHEAMTQMPVEGAERGTVAEVYQAGYRVNGVVLRPARVVVAQ